MKVGIIGAGTMGSGIAQAFAQTEGYEVCLCDINDEFAANGKAKIAKGFEKRVAKGKMEQAAADAILNKIVTGTKEICTDCDLIVEAALEVMDVKKQTFKELQDIVKKDVYPGFKEHPGYEIMKKQARGFGAMLTIQLESKEFALAILEKVRMIRFAESLGGVETLVTYPTTQTHADVPKEIRERNGITESTLRFSVGIENIEDLIGELEKVFTEIEEEKNDGKKS